MEQASNGSTGDGARKRSSTFSQMQSKGYLERVKEKRREVLMIMITIMMQSKRYLETVKYRFQYSFTECVTDNVLLAKI